MRDIHPHRAARAVALATTLCLAVAAPARAWLPDDHIPFLDGMPDGFFGMPKHGEYMAAGVACGLRSQSWAARYRAAVERHVRERARSPADTATVMRIVDEYAAYARRSIAGDKKGYCGFTANPTDMATADGIVAGVAQP